MKAENISWLERAERSLPEGWALKPLQREALGALAAGDHVFAGLPTGYGKSLCYILPAKAWHWRIWVVSPLVSLMDDQMAACRAFGVRAVAWHSGLGSAREERERRLRSADWDVLLTSPERLVRWWENGALHAWARTGGWPDLLVFDEMHCLEDWRDFRKGYRALFEPVRWAVARGTKVLGLSASFPRDESEAWMRELTGEPCSRVAAPLGRENLSLLVLPIEQEWERWWWLAASVRDLRAPATALVYCASVAEAEETALWLTSLGVSAVAFHGNMPAEWRRARSEAFRAGRLRVVCATTAFGLGVDYPHVDRVLHFSVPYDLSAYWQEAGRAGRGGGEAVSLALWRKSELVRLRGLSPEAAPRYQQLWKAWMRPGCRKAAVGTMLGAAVDPCGKCDQCRNSWEDLPRWVADGLYMFRRAPWWLSPFAEPEAWLDRRAAELREGS